MVERALGHQLAEWFEANQRTQFTGKIVAHSQTGDQWVVYFLFGRLIWASGGSHRFRRWFRLLTAYIPEVPRNQLPIPDTSISRLWEYSVLRLLLEQRDGLVEPISALIIQTITEVIFEVLQEAAEIHKSDSSARRIKKLGNPIAVIRPDQSFQQAQKQWEQWKNAGLEAYSPNLAPKVEQPELLKKQLAEVTFNKLETLLTGTRSLRELSTHLGMDLLLLTQAIFPFIEQEIICFNTIPDWVPPASKKQRGSKTLSSSRRNTSDLKPPPLILGIDDSPSICRILEKIMAHGGYRFLGVQDSFQALPMVLKHKPDFIFLDLTMPIASGYEVCAQIRRISTFQSTPIVILSGNDGMVDRVRAKLVGASDFLSKPFQPDEVLRVVNRYLKPTLKPSKGEAAAG